MKILVCYKWVPDEQDIRIGSDLKLDMTKVKWKISEYDKNAIEEAALQAENNNAEVACLTFGANAKPSLKDALSRGPEKAYWINDKLSETADGFVTANVIAAAIQKIGVPELIFFGEGSEDTYGQQVGPRVAQLLGIPALTFVTKTVINEKAVTVTRNVGNSIEEVSTQYPAVLCMLPEINKPRIPSLKQVLKASKKPTEEMTVAELGLSEEQTLTKNKIKSVRGFVMDRKKILYKDGTAEEKVAALTESMKKEGFV